MAGASKPPAYVAVANVLRARIVDGSAPQGTKLPSEVALAAAHGVSRSTIREALRSLASEHLVVTQRGLHGGSFVALPDADDVTAGLSANLSLLITGDGIRPGHLIEARRMLEVPAAALAAARRSPRHLDALSPWLVNGQPSPARAGDETFHATIVQAAGNPLVDVACSSIFAVLRSSIARAEQPEAFWSEVDNDHVAIADAVASADEDRAAAAMGIHLDRLSALYVTLDADLPDLNGRHPYDQLDGAS